MSRALRNTAIMALSTCVALGVSLFAARNSACSSVSR